MAAPTSLIGRVSRMRVLAGAPRDEVEAYQRSRLTGLLEHAFDTSPHYRRVFGEAGITRADLATVALRDLPELSKEELIGSSAALRGGSALPEGAREVHSSGSTGEPAYFVYDAHAWDEVMAGVVRGAVWGLADKDAERLLSGGLRVAYVAATDGPYAGVMAVGDALDALGAAHLELDINMPLTTWSERLREFGPNVLIGYPSALRIVAGLVDSGEVSLEIARVVSCGEPLGASLRAYLADAFDAAVVNFYGASESLALGVEADPDGEGLVLFDDLNIVEPCGDHILVTALYNRIMPVIRYRMSDHLTLRGGDRPTAGFTRADAVRERDEDLMWFTLPDGTRDFLHPLAVEGICFPGLVAYQFCPSSPASFDMVAQLSAGADSERIERDVRGLLDSVLRAKGLAEVTYRMRFVREIAADPRTGKTRLVVGSLDAYPQLVG